MKRMLSFFLALILLFGLTPSAFAANVQVPDEPPYSKPFLENLSGATYLGFSTGDDTVSEDGTLLHLNRTAEGYDVKNLLPKVGYSWNSAEAAFHDAFKAAGLREFSEKTDSGETIYLYMAAPDEHHGMHFFYTVPYVQNNGILVAHEYVIGVENAPPKAGFENFQHVNQYPDGKFSDVKAADWFSSGVKLAYELGLINGVSETSFSPASEITVAQTITIASRLNSIYRTGQANFAQSEIWYTPYVDYAVQNGIIASGQYTNYDEAITRGHFASIMHAALPADAWTSINSINSLPDVDVTTQIGKSVLALYQAGVLTGNDQYGTFSPDNKIQRSEAAAMLTRMAIPSKRKTFSLVSLPTYVTLPDHAIFIRENETLKIDATIGTTSANTDKSLTWTSSLPDYVSVNENGVITGIKVGLSTITATTINGKSGTCDVTVFSTEGMDVFFSILALHRLQNRLKFPDTLKLYNIWAYDYNDKICIYIYYSAENSLGQRLRREYQVAYIRASGEFWFEQSNDSLSSHSSDRPVNIDKVLNEEF